MELSLGLRDDVGEVREDLAAEEEVRGRGGRLRRGGRQAAQAADQDRGEINSTAAGFDHSDLDFPQLACPIYRTEQPGGQVKLTGVKLVIT